MVTTPVGAVLAVGNDELADLRSRLRATRWPPPWPQASWEAGTDPDELRRLVSHWASDYDWRVQEAEINALPWYVADIAGLPVHFLRFDAERPGALPLVLTNGWPSSFLELVTLARRLANPSASGGDPSDAFTVVVPCLPGFAFTPQQPSLLDATPTHELWHRLMHDELGFGRYAAHGGDLGAGTTALLAQAHPASVVGIHLLAVANPVDVDASSVTADEQAYLDEVPRGRTTRGRTNTNSTPDRSASPTGCRTHRPACWAGSWRSTGRGRTAAASCPPGSATTSS